MSIVLPTAKVPAETQDPKNLILFGLPKVGKTTILSTLENNLILDFENGSTYVDALKVKVSSVLRMVVFPQIVIVKFFILTSYSFL